MKTIRSRFLQGACLSGAVLASGVEAEESKPNIILIFVDDMGYTDIGIHGFDPDVYTPQLDQLARDGALFTDGYVTAPQCVPSRASLLTGRHQNVFGMDDNHKGPLPLTEITLADRLQDIGYATGMVGKWHLNPVPNSSHHEWDGESTVPYLPRNRGFEDYWFGSLNSYEVNYTLDGTDHPDAPVRIEDTRMRVDVQTEAALAFLERRTDDERPFFLYLAWFAPHAPMATPTQLQNGLLDYWSYFPQVEEDERRRGLAINLAMDYGLGLIRDKLDAMGVTENTLIFFISDNGAPLRPAAYIGSHNQPLIGEKGMETDGGQRVPYIAAWPGTIPTNTVFTEMVCAVDASATVLEAAGAPLDETIEGHNLIPFLRGEQEGPVREALYWRWRSQAAIRKGNWKFIRLGDEYRWLFDMTEIGRETAADCKMAEFPQLAADLEQELIDYANDNWHFTEMPTTINSQDMQFYVDHVDPLLVASFFTWAGEAVTLDWGAASNWSGGETPSFNSDAVLVWPVFWTGNRVSTLGTSDRTARSILFSSLMEQDATIRLQEGLSGGPARTLRMEASSGNAAIEIDDEVLGHVVFDGAGTLRLQSDLDVVQYGDASLTFACRISGPGNLTLTGAGPVRFDGENTFAGTLTVKPMGRIGGGGSLAGSLVLQDGAWVEFDAGKTLTVNGATVDLGELGVNRIAGLDESVAPGTYTLINGTASFDFSRVGDGGFDNRVAIGGGMTAYLRPGSLQVVVQPVADRFISLHSAAQQLGTRQVEIEYTGYSTTSGTATVSLSVTDSLGGPVATASVSGDVGSAVDLGENRTIVWDAGEDWNGEVDELTFTLTMDDGTAPVSDTVVSAVDTRDYVLEVLSAHGTPDPGVGTHIYSWRATLGASITSPDGGFYCEGWVGSGIEPAAGGGTSTGGITLTEPEATLTWLWMEDTGQSVWTGGADDGTAENARWNVAGNWLTGVAPVDGNTTDLLFHTRTAGNRTSYVGTEPTVRSITFNKHVDEEISIILENHAGEKRTLTFSSDSGTALLAVDADATADITLSGGTSIAMTSDLEIAHNGTGWLTLGGSGCKLAGAGNMILTGSGWVRIADAGATENTGAVSVEGGILSVQLQRALNGILNTETTFVTVKSGAAVVVENGWTDDQFANLLVRPGTIFESSARIGFNTAGGNRTYSAAIADTSSGALGLVKVGNNTLTLGGSSSYTGGSYLLDGTVSISSAANLGAASGGVTLDGGALRAVTTGDLDLGSARTTTVLERGGTLDVTDPAGNLQITGPLTGTGPLRIRGAGEITLSHGANSFSGDTRVNDGATLTVADGGSLSFKIEGDGENTRVFGEGTVNLNGTVTFDLSRADRTVGASWTVIDHDTLAQSYGETFAVAGFSKDGTVWTGAAGGAVYAFDEASGILEVTGVAPRVLTILSVQQQPGTKQVELAYTSYSDETGTVDIGLAVTNSTGGAVSATSLSGAVGSGTATGDHLTLTWDAGADWNGNVDDLTFTLSMDDGVETLVDVASGIGVDTRDYTLEVISAHGTPDPAVGTHLYAWGASVSPTVTTEDGSFICMGWAGTGSVPASGNTLPASPFTLTEVASSITWIWEEVDGFVWNGGADDGTAINARWNVDENWVGGTRPAYGNTIDVVFHTLGAGNRTSYLGADAEIRSLFFNGNAIDDLTIITENHLSTVRTLTFRSDSGPASISIDSEATAAVTMGGGGDISLKSALEVEHNGTGLLMLGVPINSTETNALTFSGTGTTRLAAANTFAGNVHLNGGTVQFDLGNNFGNANNNLIFDGGIIQFIERQTAVNIGNDRDITLNAGGGTIDVQTDRILIIPGLLSGTGDLTVTGLADGSARIRLDNEQNRLNWSGNLNIENGGQVDFSSRDALMDLNKTINLDDGTLRLIAAGIQNIHPNTTIAVGENGGVLMANHPDGEITVRGSITGTGLLNTGRSANDGLINLVNLVENTSSGGIRVAGGTTRINAIAQLGSGDITLDGGTLEDTSAAGQVTGTRTTTVGAGGGTFRVTDPSANLRINGLLAGSGTIVVKGPGRVTPSNTGNTFSGGWMIRDGGIVSVASASVTDVRLGGVSVTFDNGSLLFSGVGSQALNRATVIESGGGTFVLGNDSGQNPTITWNGAISGEGDLTVANNGGTSGKLTLGGENTYSGDTVVNGGSTLELANSGSLAFTIGNDGVNNRITGEGTVNLNGTIVFDLAGAGTTPGDSWTIVGDETDATYGGTFSVGGFDDEGSGIWTKEINGDTWYEFDQDTGVLQVKTSASPEPEPFAIDEVAIQPVGNDLSMTVHFDSTGHIYTLQSRSNLVTGAWEDLVSGTESPLGWTNDTAQGFFRIKAE